MKLTYKYRVKDKHAARLNAQARAVNFVWNYCNEVQHRAVKSHRPWLSGYDLWKLVAGATKEGLNLHSHSAMRVCIQYHASRRKSKKPWLRWRSKRSLGWVPHNGHVAFSDGAFVFRKQRYDVWLHRPLPEGTSIGAGSFNQDSKGRWYLNLSVEIPDATVTPIVHVGIDLGLSSLVAQSNGEVVESPQFYRKSEEALAMVQRARKSKRTKAIHAKIQNRRKDFAHKLSTKITNEFGFIVVGDVSSSAIAQTQFAKSTLDAGWANLKGMLSYKSIRNGGKYLEVSERYTSQTCSECGSLPPSRPRGIAGLRKRTFECICGAVLDRDVNAARNILRAGHSTLEGGAHV